MEIKYSDIKASRKRFNQLEHKHWDWRSFYNGWLESLSYIQEKQKAEEKLNEKES